MYAVNLLQEGSVQQIFVRKILVAMLVFVPIATLSPFNIIKLFVLVGIPHIFISFIYLSDRGFFSRPKIMLFAVAAGGIVGLIFLQLYAVLVFITALHFFVHYLFDEARMFNTTLNREHFYFLVPIAAIFSYLTLVFLFSSNSNLLEWGVILTLPMPLLSIKKFREDLYLKIYLLLHLVVLTVIFFNRDWFYLEQILGFIILMHYVTWYIEFYLTKCGDIQIKKKYIWRVSFVNLFFVSLGALYFIFSQDYLAFLFSPIFFYGWTLLHTLFTIRASDYGLAPGLARQ